MNKSSEMYRFIDRLFENALVFNLNQIILDGGKKRQIERFLAGVPYQSVVDIGCGTGNWATLADDKYLGVDTSPSFIASCKKRYKSDPRKEFLLADATSLALSEPFDLAILVSVLHHLSDTEVEHLAKWVAQHARYFFVLDLYPNPGNPISEWLYRMDRGNYIREPGVQQELLLKGGQFRLIKQDGYFAPTKLYRHILFLLESLIET